MHTWADRRNKFLKGRAALWLREQGPCIRIEWGFGSKARFLHIGARWDGIEGKIVLFAGVRWLFSLFLSLEHRRLLKRAPFKAPYGRKVSVSHHDETIWLYAGGEDYRKALNLGRLLRGRSQYVEVPIDETDLLAVLPEASYPVHVRRFISEWRYPRWPTRRLQRAEVEVLDPAGIYVPGKGTEAYNCGDDATFGMTCVAATAQEAVDKLVESVLRDRKRYPL